MDRPIITRPRMIYRGDHSSEKFNFFINQLLMETFAMADILTLQDSAVSEDLDKMVDSSSSYTTNQYHPYQCNPATQPIQFNLNGATVAQGDIHQNNQAYALARDKARFILRRLG